MHGYDEFMFRELSHQTMALIHDILAVELVIVVIAIYVILMLALLSAPLRSLIQRRDGEAERRGGARNRLDSQKSRRP